MSLINIHFSFGLFTAFIIYIYFKSKTNHYYGLLGSLFFLPPLFYWAEKIFSTKYLVLAAISCGLAVGTKYNGLITFFLLTCFVPALLARSKQDKPKSLILSLKYCSLFFTIALLAVSPWLIRNYLWTGNPIFPLYNNLFNPQPTSSLQATSQSISLGIYKIRELLYHETPLQIIFLPLRVFFEGQDNLPQYFDGKLHPLLLILPLFSFLRHGITNNEKIEKTCLALFAVLFFLFALFTTSMRIRYISPIIPPLVILSIFGFRNISIIIQTYLKNRVFYFGLIFVIILTMFVPTIDYLKQQFKITPLQYINGDLSRDEYLATHRLEYTTIDYANKYLPEDAKLLCVFMGNRGYYIDREHIFAESVRKSPFFVGIHTKPLPETLNYLRENHLTHLLIRDALMIKTINDIAVKDKWMIFFNNHTRRLFSYNGYSLYQIDSIVP